MITTSLPLIIIKKETSCTVCKIVVELKAEYVAYKQTSDCNKR